MSLLAMFLAAPPTPDSVVPTPEKGAPAPLTEMVNTVLGLVAWAGAAAGVAGVLITGTMMTVSMKRGGSSQHMSRLGMVLGGCILVATAGPVVGFVFGDGGQ
ncbi:hypothetical protein [Streptomyces sp. enrichment culture]|uniref:hypothetical protein n=1 Tax=Streptomyces sp. enrichment culture TaxID=1795815 RepID=UPI003F555046